ncbi:glycoside hydrolase family 127 protein [Hufsiella ginkgonis]|uniref:Glycoside hydrolase family 127 protein n=1 Tax=Hufsiella ginkgonis TaxID=2695274 RepID=A0A7K1Y189_9SPHI|nr:glycoside hydrolase family 127 protein [Hufsiella ginkgonis]MXV17014.1 glycoside hydrolase family 127 protein [Hufsiella ginkgonis]
MKRILLFLMFSGAAATAQVKDYPYRPVAFTSVKLSDNFWTPRIETNRTVTIPASFERCENTGRVKNFQMAAQHSGKFGTTFPFDDTDIYKTIEGASFSLAVHPDKKLDAYVDSMIVIIAGAQEPDGYLYTARTIDPAHPHAWSGTRRWENEHDNSHELYNSGHLFEAASAHFLATGKRNLLNIALKNADLLVNTFGPDKMHVAPGHEVVEMGLVRLYRITSKKEYLDLAKFFLDERGKRQYNKRSKNPFQNGEYWQNAKPVIDQDEAVGHAVRAMYLYSAMADVAALTGDRQYLNAIDHIWDNMVGKKLYVQGGIGAVPDGERFGDNYDLPNGTAYNETCAAIGNVMWNQRMFQLHGEAKYVDVLEKTLYNGLISGVGMDGKSFFYTNAMQIKHIFAHKDMEGGRSGWFECSCCPTNIVRLIPSIPGYVYAQNGDAVFVNLFIPGTADIVVNNKPVQLIQQNNYPWDGRLQFTLSPKSPLTFTMKLRIPGWAQNKAVPSDLYTFSQAADTPVTIRVNGEPVNYAVENGYAVLKRTWKKNDRIEMNLPMEVRSVVANPLVREDLGKVALQRGPIIYCAEWADNDGSTSNFLMPKTASLSAEFDKGLFNGVTVLRGSVPKVMVDASGEKIDTGSKPFTAIPYYAWAHRGKGEMTVWFPQKVTNVDLISK